MAAAVVVKALVQESKYHLPLNCTKGTKGFFSGRPRIWCTRKKSAELAASGLISSAFHRGVNSCNSKMCSNVMRFFSRLAGIIKGKCFLMLS